MTVHDIIENPEKFYIDGAWTAPSGTAQITVLNSATEEVFEVVAEAQEADVNRAVEAARRAFDRGPWPRMSHEERADYLRRLADELDKRAERHARIWTTESGVLHSIAAARMGSIAATYRYYADLAATYPFQERHPSASGGELALLVREPVGVVGAIVPWNGTPGLITSKVAPALLAGCTVIVKASPEAPGSAYILAEAAHAAGLPEGVVNILTADREVSEKLVAHPGVDKIAFTGSTVAGMKIGAICGGRIARQTLELGGKSPALILDDYDVETAARTITEKATFLTGQVCASLTRILVSRSRHDDLVEALSSNFATVNVGDPFESACQMGPLAMSRQRDRVEGYIAKGKDEGAVLATGGGRPAHLNRGYFVEPTVFGNVENSFTIAREEIFGPVLSVIPVDGEREMIDVANDTNFGLNASVFTNDFDKAYSVAREIRSGTVGQNSYRAELGLAFGGFKQSGLGREGGTEGLHPYLETKVVVLDGMPSNAGRIAG
ncbi:aldehyde dehydrogenase [Celeribacter indicus]|uniref:Aldehyde dehydrogenase n=1 Tax=Celeribacter indicus TaxID=1208324 RepID=A0A0B5EA72_9RHOB|nr:aldehyde dehydrogenase [Celeribacter indicus]AJE49182.1 aldehyde dehydrogenase [Celeribacter indicus]SDX18289.1 Acyl-CoA reductase [Celeribacter indicus]